MIKAAFLIYKKDTLSHLVLKKIEKKLIQSLIWKKKF